MLTKYNEQKRDIVVLHLFGHAVSKETFSYEILSKSLPVYNIQIYCCYTHTHTHKHAPMYLGNQRHW